MLYTVAINISTAINGLIMDTTTPTIFSTTYEQACSKCIDDLYHTAYITLVNADTAEKLVTEICVAGVYKYDNLEDEADIRYRLTSDLYHRLKRRLWFFTPNTDALPELLQVFSKQERLIVAMWFSSGLSAADSGRILGLSQDEYRKTISDIIRRVPL